MNTRIRRDRVDLITEPIERAAARSAPPLHAPERIHDDLPAIAQEPMVNPLWMITVSLAAFFGLVLLLTV